MHNHKTQDPIPHNPSHHTACNHCFGKIDAVWGRRRDLHPHQSLLLLLVPPPQLLL
jgi:hypothetical protein